MLYRASVFVAIFLYLIGFPLVATSQTIEAPPQEQPGSHYAFPPQPGVPARAISAPPIRMIRSGLFEMGGVHILKKEGQIEFPAAVNMNAGLLEYLIVGGSGKLHESLLSTEVEPYAIQIALLMIGLEGSLNPLSRQGDTRRPEGDPVSIWVKWQEGTKVRKSRIEDWVYNNKTKRSMSPIRWVFTGSYIFEGVFVAQVEKSIVAVFRDPVAIIDNPLPEGASDEIWFVNKPRVPLRGTEVTVVIRKESGR